MRKHWTAQELINFENKISKLYLDNKLPYLFHLSGGNEQQLIDIFKNINDDDYVISNHRSHYHALLHGIEPDELESKILNGRSMFIYDREKNFFCSSIIGGTPAIAAGIAWALKRKGSNKKVWCFVGDGTEDSGHLYEAIRYVDGYELPCKFIIENNNRSVESSNIDRWGKTAEYNWNSPSVIKYHYNITYPHARLNGKIDLSKTKQKTDIEYFPLINHDNFYSLLVANQNNLTYKEAMNKAMIELGNNGCIFIGYNVAKGDAMGTLKGVDNSLKLETPVAENLMSGLAIGMSFEGFTPVLYFERHDFMLVAADAIGNHIDKIERISHGEYTVPLIIRAVVADSGPFYSGPTHSQNFTKVFKELVSFPIVEPTNGDEVLAMFKAAYNYKKPVMIIEKKSRY